MSSPGTGMRVGRSVIILREPRRSALGTVDAKKEPAKRSYADRLLNLPVDYPKGVSPAIRISGVREADQAEKKLYSAEEQLTLSYANNRAHNEGDTEHATEHTLKI